MQVSPSQLPPTSSFDEFLNLELTSVDPSQHDPLQDLFSPRLSDASPSSAATFLPATPPQPEQGQTALDTLNPNHIVFNDLYRTYIEPLKSRHDFGGSTAGPSTLGEGAFPFGDLFASYANDPLFQPITSAVPSVLPYTIDPSLMATPAMGSASPAQIPIIDPPVVAPNAVPAKPAVAKSSASSLTAHRASTASVMGDDEEDDDDEDDDEDDEPVLKGKSKSKKVGVATGGIVKRTGPTSCVVRDPESNDPEDWRPTPEEYKKLSSKEKRQLRNKISARNFRVRRKEYITTLEGQISDRDKLISAIRDELGIQKLENAELRQEIDNLKKAMLEGRAPPPTGLPPPSATTDISVNSPAPAPKRTSPLAKVNPNKDVSASGQAAFWAPSQGMGGVTSVHSAMMPDMPLPAPGSLTSVLSQKARINGWVPLATASLGNLPGHAARAGDNINPNLNHVPRSPAMSSGSSSDSESPSSASSSSSPLHTPPQSPPNMASLQQWNDINPFTIKTLDSYRLQLWGKMAAAGHLSTMPTPQPPTSQSLFHTYTTSGQSGSLANNLRPAFFTNPTSTPAKAEKSGPPSLSAALAGKTVASLSSASTAPAPKPAPQQVQLAAALASQSIVSRMGSAFWDAFSGTATASSSKTWDTEKIRKVLEGKAVLKVVDVEPMTRAKSVDTSLEEKFKGLHLTSGMTREDRDVDSGLASPAAFRPGVFKNLLK